MHLWRPRIRELMRDRCRRPRSTRSPGGWSRRCRAKARAAAEADLRRAAAARTGGSRSRPIRGSTATPRPSSSRPCASTALAPNIIVKIPGHRGRHRRRSKKPPTAASASTPPCRFSLPQCVAVAEAVERGLAAARARRQGHRHHGPGLHDHGRPPRRLAEGGMREAATSASTPAYLEWAGVAVFKKTYRLFQERGYRIRLLSAAFRNHMHWSEFIGGDVVISPPYAWQKRFNASDVAVVPRIDTPVDAGDRRGAASTVPGLPPRLHRRRPRRVEEFDTFPPTRRTLRQFIARLPRPRRADPRPDAAHSG